MRFPSKEEVDVIRQTYPAGTRLELTVPLDDPDAKQKAGDRATVRGVDDAGHLLVAWDMGSSLNLIPGLDSFQIVPTIPPEVQRQIQAVRSTAATNMFHWKNVHEIAEQCGFDELVEWLPKNVRLYGNYILTGETEIREGGDQSK
jgi:hypothetical protein